ncbi:MAG: non-ribosomal peptide synthetase, partial [Syntrophothermus sp.]
MNNIEDIFPLAPMQEGMMFHSLLNPGSAEYIEQISCTLKGCLDTENFVKAWDYLIQRHSVLRTAFIWEESREPLQIVMDSVPPPVEIIDLRSADAGTISAETAKIRHNDITEGFILSEAPLMKIKLILINVTETIFIWTHHHILFDGWGMQILLKELFTIYYSFSSGNAAPDLPAVRPFRDYIEWIKSQDDKSAEDFWRERLHSYVPTELALDKNEKHAGADRISTSSSEMDKLPEQLTSGLLELARNTKTTLSAILQAAWGVVLSRYSNESSAVFGLTLSVRPAELSGSESVIGLFINTIPVILQIDPSVPFCNWLQQIHASQAEAHKYAYYPLYKIQKLCSKTNGGLLFESIVVVENFPVSDIENESSKGLQLRDIDSFSRTNYPLTVVFSPGDELGIEISYDGSIYSSGAVRKLINGLKQILSSVSESPQSCIADLNVLSPAEKRLILDSFRYGQQAPVQFPSIHKWFEHTALKYPGNTAVIFGEKQLSFEKLNILSDRLADVILCSGCHTEDIIGIYMPRSQEIIVSILAVLKAGCAFMILDVKYPEDRIRHICSEAGCRIIITSESENNLFENMLTISPGYSGELQSYRRICRSPEIYPENLAYVIYTSGSTGKPKGTLLHHKGFCSFMLSMISDFRITPGSRILQSSSAGFDSSVAEIFSALLTGASLVLPENGDIFSVEDIYRILKESGTTHLSLPPSILSLLNNDGLTEIQTIAAVGESCSWHVPEKWAAENRCFINGYGPTETTVGAACFIHHGEIAGHSTATVPLGKPLRNVNILLLDSSLK